MTHETVELNPGTGGAEVSVDRIAGEDVQRIKLTIGAEGTATDVSDANPLPVELADSEISGTVELGATTLTALETTELGATTLAALETTELGATSLAALENIGVASIAAGDNNIGNVDVLSVVPGTAATSLGKAEDAAHASGDTGVMMLGVRRDANTTLAATDGDYVPPQFDSSGNLKVAIISGAGSGGTSAADGSTFTRDTTSLTPVGAVVESSAPTLNNGDVAGLSQTTGGALRVDVASGGVSGIAEDSAAAGGEEGIMLLAVRRDAASSGVSADGDFAALSVTSDGSLRVSGGGGGTQYAVDAVGGASDTGTLALAVRDDALATLTPVDGDYTQLRTNARGAQWVAMDAEAHDAALTSNPILVGGYASAAAPAGVSADGDAVRAWMLRNGAQCVQLTAAGALIAGDATNGIDVDVTRLPTLAAVTTVSTLTNITNWGNVVDDAVATPATTRVLMAGYLVDDTATDAADEGDGGMARMTPNRKQISQPYESEANSWVYGAPAGGLVSTTQVAAKAAAGAGLRNYVTAIQVMNSHQTTGTEIIVRDGAAGTVLHRGWAPPNGGYSSQFPTPLRGTANTAIEIGEITATATAGVLVNLQGYVGA